MNPQFNTISYQPTSNNNPLPSYQPDYIYEIEPEPVSDDNLKIVSLITFGIMILIGILCIILSQ